MKKVSFVRLTLIAILLIQIVVILNIRPWKNAEKQNAEVMMKPCINGSDPLVWPCVERETLDKDIFSFVIERPQGDNIQETLSHSLDNVSADCF